MKKRSIIYACAWLIALFAQAQRAMAVPEFNSEKCYKLMHVNSGKYLLLHDEYTESNSVNATTLDAKGSLFTIAKSGSGYVFTKYQSDKTLGLSTSTEGKWANWNTSNTGATAWTLEDGGGDIVYIKSSKGYLGPNDGVTSAGSYIYTNKTKGVDTKWQIVDATDELPNYVGSITSGKYYRLISNAYEGKTMTANASGGIDLAGEPELDKGKYGYYAQIWQITESGGKYQFKNLVTGNSIQTWPGQSQQWKTGTGTAANFYSGKSTSGENTIFWFATVNNTTEHKSLHAAGNTDQNNTVVGWKADSDASKWLLWIVEVTEEDMAAAEDWRKALNNNVGTEFAKFFTDAACTQLKSEYASMSDDELRSAMNALPSLLREEAVCIKNDKWSDDQKWSRFEKDFRIHEYEPYSAPGVWGAKLGFGDFGRLSQPTGIRLKAGEFAYVFVNQNVANSDASLVVEMPVATGNNGPQQAIKKGFNKVTANGDCELFITYQNANTETPLSAHPNIKIHIVGGTCNGTFDLSRGYTDSDWKWLKQNMFKDEYLHFKSNSHVFCAYLDKMRSTEKIVKGMQMLDYIFEAQESAMTTRFNDGYYRPMITVWDKGGGNPSAGNARISWPGINADLFNETSFRDGAWWTSWAYPHELGHLHQRPLWLAGTREGSNEVLIQIYTHLWGKKTAKGAVSLLASRFNNGTSWLDNLKDAGEIQSFTQKMWYQLWLYHHQKGDDEFFPRWIAAIHKRGNIQSRWASNENPAGIEKDYMLAALAACEAAQTDLYEFFKVWGFFNYAENVKGSTENGVATISDYEKFYLKVPRKSVSSEVAKMEAWKKEMQSYQKKAPGIMFINSTSEQGKISKDAEVAKYFPSLVGTNIENFGAGDDSGCTGYFTHYGKNEAKNLAFKISGTTVAITGSGAVGFKIYDDKGELIWISFKKSIPTNKTIAEGIKNGTYSLVASLGDDTDLLLSGPETDYAKKDPTGISLTPDPSPTGEGSNDLFDLSGRKVGNASSVNGNLPKGIYIVNGRKVVVK